MFRRCPALLAIRKTMAFWTTDCVRHLRRKTPIPELESQQPHRRKDLPFFPCRGATLESEVRNPFAMSHDRRRGFFVPASLCLHLLCVNAPAPAIGPDTSSMHRAVSRLFGGI
jgi:hypothetical protein